MKWSGGGQEWPVIFQLLLNNNSSFQNYTNLDDHTQQTTDTPGFKPFTKFYLLFILEVFRYGIRITKRRTSTVRKILLLLIKSVQIFMGSFLCCTFSICTRLLIKCRKRRKILQHFQGRKRATLYMYCMADQRFLFTVLSEILCFLDYNQELALSLHYLEIGRNHHQKQ